MPSWELDAACRGLPTRWWFSDDATAALRVCSSCLVRQACLDAAVAEERYPHGVEGVRGGLTAKARRRLLRTRGGPF